MLLIPAIDLKNGKCVRLYQGKFDRETLYSDDPVSVAVSFEKRGARRLHVVDLDGAYIEKSPNFHIIRDICQSVSIPVECGGGIRDLDTANRFLNAGISEIILGTLVIKEPLKAAEIVKKCGPDRVQIGFDFKDDSIAVNGWKELVPGSVTDEINKWHEGGVSRFILTDITKDGTMEGPNIEALRTIAATTEAHITAAGGVSKPDDIKELAALEPLGVDRVISGKAIYENTIRLEDFL